MRPLPTICLFAFSGLLHAQSPNGKPLREHIVRSVDATGLDEYRDDRIPTIPDTSICFIYVGQKQNGPLWLRLQIRYASYNALYLEKIRFAKNGRYLEITPAKDLLNYGTNGMMQWEWYDTPPSEYELKAIRGMISDPGVTLVLIGRERTVERSLSDLERQAMENVFEQALVLGRTEP